MQKRERKKKAGKDSTFNISVAYFLIFIFVSAEV
jgi:hypothetical protein